MTIGGSTPLSASRSRAAKAVRTQQDYAAAIRARDALIDELRARILHLQAGLEPPKNSPRPPTCPACGERGELVNGKWACPDADCRGMAFYE